MRISDICSRNVVCIAADLTLRKAAELMQKQQVGALVVTNAQRNPTGIVTDRDLVINAMASGKDPETWRVADVMNRTVVTCREDHELFDAIEFMHQRGIRRLPVVDAQYALVGIVTSDDIVGALAEHVGMLARSLIGSDALERRRYQEHAEVA